MGGQDRTQARLFQEFNLDEVMLHLACRWFSKLNLDDKIPAEHKAHKVVMLGKAS
jgi:hypothetical protein